MATFTLNDPAPVLYETIDLGAAHVNPHRVFIRASNFRDRDTINNFNPTKDVLDFSAIPSIDIPTLLANATELTTGVRLAHGSIGQIVINGVTKAQLSTKNFLGTNGTGILPPAVFINPPAGGNFGFSLAGHATNEVIIGAPNATVNITGQAYRFNFQVFQTGANSVATTFNSPTPVAGGTFGVSVDSDGTDVLIGEAQYNAPGPARRGFAHLFNNAGALSLTFNNPKPGPNNDAFGFSVALGSGGNVFIGTPFYEPPANAAAVDPNKNDGRTYRYSSFSTTTFENPTPNYEDEFGAAIAVAGANNVLIAAPEKDINGDDNAGIVYLFGNDGTLLKTIQNPSPGTLPDDRFGLAVASNSSGTRFLIGAPGEDTNNAPAPFGDNHGKVYLYEWDGVNTNLLNSPVEIFTNPNPDPVTGGRGFGAAVEFLNNDILIGSPGSFAVNPMNPNLFLPVPDRGAAYLFRDTAGSTNTYTRLQTFVNPQTTNDAFGASIAVARGGDDLIIGAPFYNPASAAIAPGRAYVFDFYIP